MRVLSLDSASGACAVCVWQDGRVLAQAEERMERGQDARLIPLVLEVMAKAKTDFTQLDRIAVTRGPGSFTGLRIGLAAARGIGMAAEKPVIGINRFTIFREQNLDKNLFIILESKRQELFCQFYPAQTNAAEPSMMLPEEIVTFARTQSNLTLAGDALHHLRQLLPSMPYAEKVEPEVITASILASRAALGDPDFLPRPLYLRAPDVTMLAAG